MILDHRACTVARPDFESTTVKIQKLQSEHPNYREPINARWFVEVEGVTYYNRTRDGLRDQVMRTIWNQRHDPRKEPWPGGNTDEN